jgi:hypothetical protein
MFRLDLFRLLHTWGLIGACGTLTMHPTITGIWYGSVPTRCPAACDTLTNASGRWGIAELEALETLDDLAKLADLGEDLVHSCGSFLEMTKRKEYLGVYFRSTRLSTTLMGFFKSTTAKVIELMIKLKIVIENMSCVLPHMRSV